MGLFDGYDGKSEAGSTAQMAKWLNLPVLLAVNAKSMARSAAAVVYGFEKFDPDLRFGGVIFNQLGSSRHLNYLKDALSGHVQMPCLGGLLKNADIAIPERHLGLVTLQDHPLSPDAINRLADFFESSVDMDALLACFSDFHADPETAPCPQPLESGRVRIGVAMDQAFCFYYPDNLDALTAAGAELVPFSPISDSGLPEGLGGIYFGGGYPELHAEKLAANSQSPVPGSGVQPEGNAHLCGMRGTHVSLQGTDGYGRPDPSHDRMLFIFHPDAAAPENPGIPGNHPEKRYDSGAGRPEDSRT